MNIDFNGFNEKVITMQADSTITKPNQWIKVVSNGTAAQADANGKLVGVTVNVRSDYCGVMVNGVVTAKKSGDIALGYTKLVYTAAGIAQSTTGREHLVLSVTDDAVTFIL